MTREQIDTYFADKEKLLVEAVSRLVSIDSTEGKPSPGAPFGPGPAAALDEAVREILDHCYAQAVSILEESRADVDKVVAYLLEKETITGGEMVAIIEGRDPTTVEDAYASTRKAVPGDIEPPAKSIHIVSEEIKPPAALETPEEQETPEEESSEPAPADEDQKSE